LYRIFCTGFAFDVITNYIADVVLAPAGVPDSEQEFSCLDDIVDDEGDDEDFISLPTFKETDKCSMKIVSFPEMKKVVESSLSCTKCLTLRHRSNVVTE